MFYRPASFEVSRLHRSLRVFKSSCTSGKQSSKKNSLFFLLYKLKSFFLIPFAMLVIVSHAISIVACVVNAVSSPVAVVGNALILVAIYKNPSLRTPSYTLLSGLALTDFFTGLLPLPVSVLFTVLAEFMKKEWPSLCLIMGIFQHGIGSYLGLTAIFVITVMSVERWLLICRRSTISTSRVFKAYVAICLLPTPFITSRLARSLDGCVLNKLDAAEGIVVFVCLLITSVFYLNVLQIIRRQQLQIQASQPNQGFGQAAIDIAKYKKSVIMLLYILALFSVCYLPSAIFLQVTLFYQEFQFTAEVTILTKILSTLYFLSSALNPLLYCWRTRNLRVGVRQLLMRIFQQNV